MVGFFRDDGKSRSGRYGEEDSFLGIPQLLPTDDYPGHMIQFISNFSMMDPQLESRTAP
jgi:hypothetical protein